MARIGAPYSESELAVLVSHVEAFRFPNDIPPGYLDSDKSSGLRGAGDYIIWRQLIEYIGEGPSKGSRDAIFVTLDAKDDLVDDGG